MRFIAVILIEVALIFGALMLETLDVFAPAWFWGFAALVCILAAALVLFLWPSKTQHPTSGRIYTPRTPEEIRDEVKDRTEIQAEDIARRYIGSWMIVEGVVFAVYESISNAICVMISRDNEPTFAFDFNKGRYKQTFAMIDKGDKIVVEGKIRRINKELIHLADCELVKHHGKGQRSTS